MWPKNVRYLDYNAGAGVNGSVRKKLTELLSQSDFFFANPSSQHRLGQQAQQQLMRSEMKIAASLGSKVESKQLVFTSSGTEANQTVIRSAMKFADTIIIGAGEHSASHDLISSIPSGIQTTELPLLSNGQYDFEFLRKLLRHAKQSGRSKVFLSLFWANNETGVLTSLSDLDAVMRSSGLEVSLHLDGAQAWGKLELDLFQTPANYVTFSAHKIGALAGTGMIWIRPSAVLHPLMPGSQEGGLRGGTENILGISALAYAVEELNPGKFTAHTEALRNHFEKGLCELDPKKSSIRIWGSESPRISNTSRISFLGFSQNENWVERFDLLGFEVSHGSACKSQLIKPSRVLLKMGATAGEALNAVRVSFGPTSQDQEVNDFLVAIQSILREKRPQQ